ncbi:MAG: hypothetical protein MUO43_09580, partial [Desulfobacterales bacterium]|nr:hypothetical protein [Desulfobacterales bacterium]
GAVRGVAENTLSLHRIIPVTFTKSSLIILMTGKAEAVFVLFEKEIHARSMVYMTAGTSHCNRCMHIRPGKLLPVMTCKAYLRAAGFKQAQISAVMCRVAGQTAAFGNRLVHRLLLAFLFFLPMTDKTLFRRILAQKSPADHSMMKMTSLAIIFLYRFVNDPLFKSGSHIGVTFHTAFPGLANRLSADTGNKQTKDERESKK